MSVQQFIPTANSTKENYFSDKKSGQQLIDSGDFIKKLLSLDPPWKHFPDVAGKRKRFLQKQTDEQLIQLIAEGNNYAFDVLCARYTSFLKNYLRRFDLPHFVAIEDVIQDVFLKFYNTIIKGAYRDEGALGGLLAKAARNRALNVIYKDKRLTYESESTWPVPQDRSLVDRLFGDERRELMSKAIELLPPRMSSIVRMHFQEEKSFKEIDQELGLGKGSAASLCSKAVKMLKRKLKASGK